MRLMPTSHGCAARRAHRWSELFADVDEIIAVDERGLLTGNAIQRLQILPPLVRRLRAARFSRVFLLHADLRYRVLTAPLTGVPVVSQSSRNAHGADESRSRPIHGRRIRAAHGRPRTPRPDCRTLSARQASRKLPARRATADRRVRRIALVPGGARNVAARVRSRWPVDHYAGLVTRTVE